MYTWNEKIHIGISACLYGCHVRYNLKGWDMIKHIGRDREMFVFHPLCPEVMSGMGVPRPSIRIKGESGAAVWEGRADVVDSHGKNWTGAIKDASRSVMDVVQRRHIRAYIFMEGSPTCGVYRTTLKNKRLGKPPGVHGAKLIEEGLFLIDGAILQSPIKWWDTKRRLLAFLYLDQLTIQTKAELYDVWHHYKFLCQEINEVQSRELGHRLANLPKHVDLDTFSALKIEILDILRNPSTSAKIRQMLWKHYTYLRKTKDIVLEEVKSPEDLRGMQLLAKELLLVERTSYSEDVLYGQVPVMFRRS
jgi:uncharacterized protein YbbK (DUF523 family)